MYIENPHTYMLKSGQNESLIPSKLLFQLTWHFDMLLKAHVLTFSKLKIVSWWSTFGIIEGPKWAHILKKKLAWLLTNHWAQTVLGLHKMKHVNTIADVSSFIFKNNYGPIYYICWDISDSNRGFIAIFLKHLLCV